MKKIVCELCESTKMMKIDGMFVCQNCGTKYSVEDARKLMVEFPDEPSDETKPVNSTVADPQVSNLLELANVSFSSKNYAEAEKFCNQVIQLDAKNYEAWKLKGDSIYYQINADNPRILEVYNNYINAYKVLSIEGRNAHKEELLSLICNSYENNTVFWINQVEIKRPTAIQIQKAEDSFVEACSKISSAYDEMLVDGKEDRLALFENLFIRSVNTMVYKAWNSTVGYNYYRKDLLLEGAQWKRSGRDYSPDFRPGKEILSTFITECDNLVKLLKYAENQINDKTDSNTKINLYNNISFLRNAPIGCKAYIPMIETIRNGYGAVTKKIEYWEVDRNSGLSSYNEMMNKGEATRYKEKADQIDAVLKKEAFEKYWAEHADEKQKLEKDKEDIKEAIDRSTSELESISGVKSIEREKEALKNKIDELKKKRDNLGLFKGKEKQALQAQIEEKEDEYAKILQEVKKEAKKRESLNSEIKFMKTRLQEIETELTMDR